MATQTFFDLFDTVRVRDLAELTSEADRSSRTQIYSQLARTTLKIGALRGDQVHMSQPMIFDSILPLLMASKPGDPKADADADAFLWLFRMGRIRVPRFRKRTLLQAAHAAFRDAVEGPAGFTLSGWPEVLHGSANSPARIAEYLDDLMAGRGRPRVKLDSFGPGTQGKLESLRRINGALFEFCNKRKRPDHARDQVKGLVQFLGEAIERAKAMQSPEAGLLQALARNAEKTGKTSRSHLRAEVKRLDPDEYANCVKQELAEFSWCDPRPDAPELQRLKLTVLEVVDICYNAVVANSVGARVKKHSVTASNAVDLFYDADLGEQRSQSKQVLLAEDLPEMGWSDIRECLVAGQKNRRKKGFSMAEHAAHWLVRYELDKSIHLALRTRLSPALHGMTVGFVNGSDIAPAASPSHVTGIQWLPSSKIFFGIVMGLWRALNPETHLIEIEEAKIVDERADSYSHLLEQV